VANYYICSVGNSQISYNKNWTTTKQTTNELTTNNSVPVMVVVTAKQAMVDGISHRS